MFWSNCLLVKLSFGQVVVWLSRRLVELVLVDLSVVGLPVVKLTVVELTDYQMCE
jgi:hypothetical protein